MWPVSGCTVAVDGFRLDTINFYMHDKQLRDNPPLPKKSATRRSRLR